MKREKKLKKVSHVKIPNKVDPSRKKFLHHEKLSISLKKISFFFCAPSKCECDYIIVNVIEIFSLRAHNVFMLYAYFFYSTWLRVTFFTIRSSAASAAHEYSRKSLWKLTQNNNVIMKMRVLFGSEQGVGTERIEGNLTRKFVLFEFLISVWCPSTPKAPWLQSCLKFPQKLLKLPQVSSLKLQKNPYKTSHLAFSLPRSSVHTEIFYIRKLFFCFSFEP